MNTISVVEIGNTAELLFVLLSFSGDIPKLHYKLTSLFELSSEYISQNHWGVDYKSTAILLELT